MRKKLTTILAVMLLVLSLGITAAAGEEGYTGWEKIDGQWHYIMDGDEYYTGLIKSGSYTYYIYDGIMQVSSDFDIEGSHYYFDDKGHMVINKWIAQTIYGRKMWRYYGDDGAGIIGWKKISGSWFYFDEDAIMATYWEQVEGKYYYLGSDGRMVANKWINDGGEWYYQGPDGASISGWKKIGDYWYYFAGESCKMLADTPASIEGTGYLFDKNGHMLSNKWYKIVSEDEEGTSTAWYYYGSNGAEVSGWAKIGGYWYYFIPEYANVMACDCTMDIDGVSYSFDTNGRWKK